MTVALNISMFFFIIQAVFTSQSRALLEKTGVGMSPETPSGNYLILLMIFTIIYSLFTSTPLFLTLSWIIAGALSIRYLAQLIKHFQAFLKHTSNVRRARIIYEETGEKTDRSIKGYSSINTLMLSTLVGILGFFTMAVVAYSAFTYVPENTGYSGY